MVIPLMDNGILLIPAAILVLVILTILIVLVARFLARWLEHDER